jgi:hypothetical protein
MNNFHDWQAAVEVLTAESPVVSLNDSGEIYYSDEEVEHFVSSSAAAAPRSATFIASRTNKME